jgi:hypothetical protein
MKDEGVRPTTAPKELHGWMREMGARPGKTLKISWLAREDGARAYPADGFRPGTRWRGFAA